VEFAHPFWLYRTSPVQDRIKTRHLMYGKRYGLWTILEYVPNKKPGRWYECICDCGKLKIIIATDLRAGRTTQCRDCRYKNLYDPQREIGKRYGSWTILKYIETRNKLQRYLCRCDCGIEKMQYAAELRRGRNKTCITCHNRLVAFNNIKHGFSHSKIYKVWSAMIARCGNPNDKGYRWYGARGITVCKRWHKFENFLKDMGVPLQGLQIDRIDNDKGYEPGNCRWVAPQQNLLNSRNVDSRFKKGCSGNKHKRSSQQ